MKAPQAMLWFPISLWSILLAACRPALAPPAPEAPQFVLVAEYSREFKFQKDADRVFAVLSENEIAAASILRLGTGLGMQIGVWNYHAAKARKLIEEASRSEGLQVKLLSEEAAKIEHTRLAWGGLSMPVPLAAREAADAYFASLPNPPSERERRQERELYYLMFFDGFVSPWSRIESGDAQSKQAHEAGKAYWRSHQEDLGKIMAGFGYTPVEIEGRWRPGAESSEFRPRGSASTGTWWLSMLEKVDSDLPKPRDYPGDGFSLRITGYLSPPGRHGHMGMNEHYFFATKIRQVPGSWGSH
jgi:hypothetical protein